jgi:anti-sigma B factor antagonist
VPISLQHRRVGDIAVVTCAGRLVEGAETTELRQLLDQLLEYGPSLLLDVTHMDFIDSAGLGLLVRYSTRARNGHGSLKLCGASAKLIALLKATRLEQVLEAYASESDGIRAFYERRRADAGTARLRRDILCVVESSDIQAFVREVLGGNEYGVLTAGNLPDALILLQATQPKVVVVSSALRRTQGTHTAEKFNRLLDGLAVVELPPDFASRDADDNARMLLDRIRAEIAPS